MKIWRIVQTACLLVTAALYVKGVQSIYRYFEDSAVRQAVETKTFRLDCPTRLTSCNFIEKPVHVDRFGDVILPTTLISLVLFIGAVAVAVIAYRWQKRIERTYIDASANYHSAS